MLVPTLSLVLFARAMQVELKDLAIALDKHSTGDPTNYYYSCS